MGPAMLSNLDECILQAQSLLARLLATALEGRAASRDQYARHLSFHYHLVKDVRDDLLAAAGHHDLARRSGLRDFLQRLANEEEMRYLVAAKDLAAMGRAPLPVNIDVELWHAYFRPLTRERPFIRLGAIALVENLVGGPAGPQMERTLQGSFLNGSNTRFVLQHWREGRTPGRDLLDALHGAALERRHVQDLVEGADKATVLYLRMVEWALENDSLARICDASGAVISPQEARRIAEFKEGDSKAFRVPA
ncbi:MAG: hypothetical protein ACOY4R_30490 [Pseudomonadota bacterium]